MINDGLHYMHQGESQKRAVNVDTFDSESNINKKEHHRQIMTSSNHLTH